MIEAIRVSWIDWSLTTQRAASESVIRESVKRSLCILLSCRNYFDTSKINSYKLEISFQILQLNSLLYRIFTMQ